MNQLFETEESLSPKEAWKREHNISVAAPTGCPPEFASSPEWNEWAAAIIDATDGEDDGNPPRYECHAETEEEALYKLAQSAGIKFYK